MTDYQAPLRDIAFSMNEVCGYEEHYKTVFEGADQDLVQAVLNEYARFCENVLVPLYRPADEEGCRWQDGAVSTPSGFKQAYKQYSQAGWPALSCDPEYGGQGLPVSLALTLGEMTGSANMSFALYTGGLAGAIETLSVFGAPEQRNAYERNLITGDWNATMCLTEAHCGTDLGLLRTRADPNNDGSYALTGTKIFITGGEHDLTDNIIHLVLARLPEAPPGNKGISLFIVPKVMPDGLDNGVSCGSIEHKMGIKGSATCVMNFERAQGFMLGEPNRGLQAMFKFINASRIRAAFQGVSHAEFGFQKSLAYARERQQMRAATGPKYPDAPADPIIVHPDVRRMLLTQKAFAEGNRVMLHYLAKQLDISEHSDDPAARKAASHRLDLMTPIAKGFATETGVEAANQALQCFGGHGYIREWGVEQNLRDSRIATLYEGTTGIQALDLIGRKIAGSNGETLREFCAEIQAFCQREADNDQTKSFIETLERSATEWLRLSEAIVSRAAKNPDELGAASFNFLMYSGYVSLAYFWAMSATVAQKRLLESASDELFYTTKIATAKFYFEQILPRTRACVGAIEGGAASLMDLPEDQFAF